MSRNNQDDRGSKLRRAPRKHADETRRSLAQSMGIALPFLVWVKYWPLLCIWYVMSTYVDKDVPIAQFYDVTTGFVLEA